MAKSFEENQVQIKYSKRAHALFCWAWVKVLDNIDLLHG